MAADIYAHPVSYDILATPGTAAEVDVIRRIAAARGFGPGKGLWLEPACGTGRYMRVLAARGQRIAGFDLSAAMVDYARRTLERRGLAPRTRVFRADMCDFSRKIRPASVDFAFNTYSSIRHITDGRGLARHLREMAGVLRDGGAYLVGLDFHRPGTGTEEDVWIASRGRRRVTQMVNYLPPAPGQRIETAVSHVMIERPRGVEHLDLLYELRTYTEREWLAALGRSPLKRAASLDMRGRPRDGRDLPYQYELLIKR